MSQLEAFRAAKNRFFKEHPQSPLTEEQRGGFPGLRYFPEQPALRMVLPVEPSVSEATVVMETSTGDTQVYRRLGRLRFIVDGQEAALTLFADALAGSETYGAGRYVEPELLADGRVLLDFNMAYNPYCAYNDDWSCPLTPPENRLRLAIRAGERLFHTEANA